MTEFERADLWNRLAQATQSWARFSQRRPRPAPAPPVDGPSNHSQHSSTFDQRTLFPELPLRPPQDFIHFVQDFQLTQIAMEKLVATIQRTVDERRKDHLERYEQICRGYLGLSGHKNTPIDPASIQAARNLIQKSFHQELSFIRSETIECYQRSRQQFENKRTPFNSEYTPLLEKYFEYHAYPSARDREWLARKTMMSTRQIEVWFQNHRRRARKEGIQFERLPMDRLPIQLSLNDLENKLSPLSLPRNPQHGNHRLPTPPPEQRRQATPPEMFRGTLSRGNSILDHTSRTPHAFPRKFKRDRRCDDLFPYRRGDFTFPAPIWDRRPSNSAPADANCTIDQLCEALASTRIHGPEKEASSGPPGPWNASRVTGPIVAPHPALRNPSRPTWRPRAARPSRRSPVPRRERQSSTPVPKPKRSNGRRVFASFVPTASPSLPTSNQRVIPRISSHSSLSSVDSSDLDTPDGSPSMPSASALPLTAPNEHMYDFLASGSPANKEPLGQALYNHGPFDYWSFPSQPPMGLNISLYGVT